MFFFLSLFFFVCHSYYSQNNVFFYCLNESKKNASIYNVAIAVSQSVPFAKILPIFFYTSTQTRTHTHTYLQSTHTPFKGYIKFFFFNFSFFKSLDYSIFIVVLRNCNLFIILLRNHIFNSTRNSFTIFLRIHHHSSISLHSPPKNER